jgi:hypothetical protein
MDAKDIAAKRSWIINKDHVSKLIELGLVEMRDDKPFLTIAGQNTAWDLTSRMVEIGLKVKGK